MNSGYLLLVVLAVLLAAGYLGYRKIKKKIEGFSREAFGTSSLTEGFARQADELAQTPKSVSGMTRIYGPQIQKDFPDFNLEEFKNKAENLLISALSAISERNLSLLKDSTEEVRKQVENKIADNKRAGIREVYEQIQVHQTEIAAYVKRQGTCMITFQSAVGHLHYKEKDGTVIEGDRERLTQTKYNMELLYIQDVKQFSDGNAAGTACPHCGAPITGLGLMQCEYCGLAVTPINIKVWNLHQFYNT